MANVFFISEEVLKTKTAINDNVDSGELRYCIEVAQQINIQETLGQPLYQKLMSDVLSNTLSGNYKKLMDDYIVPSLVAWAYYHALDNFFVKFMNAGLVQNSNEQGSKIDHRTFQYLKNNAKSIAEFYDQNTRRYLCAFAYLYPEYNVVPMGEILPKRSSAFGRSIALQPTIPFPSWYGPIPKPQP